MRTAATEAPPTIKAVPAVDRHNIFGYDRPLRFANLDCGLALLISHVGRACGTVDMPVVRLLLNMAS